MCRRTLGMVFASLAASVRDRLRGCDLVKCLLNENSGEDSSFRTQWNFWTSSNLEYVWHLVREFILRSQHGRQESRDSVCFCVVLVVPRTAPDTRVVFVEHRTGSVINALPCMSTRCLSAKLRFLRIIEIIIIICWTDMFAVEEGVSKVVLCELCYHPVSGRNLWSILRLKIRFDLSCYEPLICSPWLTLPLRRSRLEKEE